jgi:hypothetical protein
MNLTRIADAMGRGLVAGAAGTGALTAFQMLETKWQGREPSGAPAQAVEKVLDLEPKSERAEQKLTTVVHWQYGTVWGIPPGAARYQRPRPDLGDAVALRHGVGLRADHAPEAEDRPRAHGVGREGAGDRRHPASGVRRGGRVGLRLAGSGGVSPGQRRRVSSVGSVTGGGGIGCVARAAAAAFSFSSSAWRCLSSCSASRRRRSSSGSGMVTFPST